MERRKHPRFIKRLTTKFFSDDASYMGITSDLSQNGLYIRTKNGITPNSVVDIELYMPDHRVALLKGIVRRTYRTHLNSIKNGMGIEIIENDETFIHFVKSSLKTLEETPPRAVPLECLKVPDPDSQENTEILDEPKQERRKHERLTVAEMNVTANMSFTDEIETVNISQDGIMVKTERRLNIGSTYILKLAFEDSTLTVKARVIWCLLQESRHISPDEIVPVYSAGLQFNEAPSEKIDEFVRLIEKQKVMSNEKTVVDAAASEPSIICL